MIRRMNSPFRWDSPTTWPGPVRVWVAVVVGGWIVSSIMPLWRWIQRKRSESWPGALGKIERATAEVKPEWWPSNKFWNRRSVYISKLAYTYTPSGETFRGVWTKEFVTQEEASDFIRDLAGKPVSVAYNPEKPSDSTLINDAVAVLLSSRPPAAEIRPWVAGVPSWAKPLLWACAVLAAVGLTISLWVHVNSVYGRKVVGEEFFWMLHLGIFVVWFPAVMIAQRRTGGTAGKNFWNAVFRDSPSWLKYLVYVSVVYAVLNFLFFMSRAPTKQTLGDTPVETWRGFSGHWMAFYSSALAIFYAAIHTARESTELPQSTKGPAAASQTNAGDPAHRR